MPREEHGSPRGEVPDVRGDSGIVCLLVEILRTLYQLKAKVEKMSAELELKLQEQGAQITRLVTSSNAAEARLVGLKANLEEIKAALLVAGVTPVQMQTLTDYTATIGTEVDELDAAVEASGLNP